MPVAGHLICDSSHSQLYRQMMVNSMPIQPGQKQCSSPRSVQLHMDSIEHMRPKSFKNVTKSDNVTDTPEVLSAFLGGWRK